MINYNWHQKTLKKGDLVKVRSRFGGILRLRKEQINGKSMHELSSHEIYNDDLMLIVKIIPCKFTGSLDVEVLVGSQSGWIYPDFLEIVQRL